MWPLPATARAPLDSPSARARPDPARASGGPTTAIPTSAPILANAPGSGASSAEKPSKKRSIQRSQLLGSSQSPWMKTTGVLPLAFALSTCCVSRSVIVAM